MAFDDYFKQIFKGIFGNAVKSGVSIGSLEKSFDLWIRGDHPKIKQSNFIPDGFKNYADNVIEYKSDHDTYHMWDIPKLIGDGAYFAYNRKKDFKYLIEHTCLWFIVVNPEPFRHHYREFGFEEETTPGFYVHRGHQPDLRVVVVNELEPDRMENYLLLLLSSGERFRQFLRVLLEREEHGAALQKYLYVKFIIEDRELRGMTEVEEFKRKYSLEENIRSAIEDIGLEKVINSVGLEKVIDSIGLEKVIDSVGLERVIEVVGPEKVLKYLEPEQIVDIIGVDKLEKILQERKKL